MERLTTGYDPREAPAVWKLMAKRQGVSRTDFFWSSYDNQATRRSYLMNELKNNYRDVDLTSLRTDATRYAEIKAAVAERSKKKIKVTQ
jgi:hypothetical protein